MKLVELLARELSEWPKGVHAFAQDQCADVYPWTGVPEYDDEQWITTDDCDVAMDSYISLDIDLAEDYAADIVTRAQWQAERDRQKGGEWKRHRGGKRPVDSDVKVECRMRNGDVETFGAGGFMWDHDGAEDDIMSYLVISQPQAEEVESRGPFPCAPIGEAVNAIEYDIEFPSGVFTLEAKTDQIDGPILWRDTVNELDAYIEEFTREREALINRLALEGFALIPAMTAVIVVADVDMSDWRNWKAGDVIESFEESIDISIGSHYTLFKNPEVSGDIHIHDDSGDRRNRHADEYRFVSRP